MMRRVFSKGILSFILLQAAMLTSCILGPEGIDPDTDPTVMEVSYSIQGAAEEDLTRGVAGTADENKITGLYSLFFDPTSDGSGTYRGCSYSGVTASGNQASGNSRIGMPAGLDAQNAYSMVFIANLDIYVDKGSYASVGDWLDGMLSGKTQQWARANLIATFSSTAGIKSPLLMSGEFDKIAGSNTITNVQLKRAAARVDVNNVSTGNFQMISAQVWNARIKSYIIDNGAPTTEGLTVKYTGNVRSAISNKIETGLYFFENSVQTPLPADYNTTCLMIAGYYNGSSTLTYYRVNIHAKDSSQELLRNHIYTVKITDVKGPGETDIDDAFNKNEIMMDYIVNDWDDDFSGGYVTDQYGNRLSVSQRYVTFADTGAQEVEIEVFCIPGNVNPITGDWSVSSPLTGMNPDKFTAVKKGDGLNKYFVTAPVGANVTMASYAATATVTWGSLSLDVYLKQVSPNDAPSDLKATPGNLWFSKNATLGDEKQFQLDVRGNYFGIDPSTDITISYVWMAGGQDWVTAAFDQDMGSGIYRFVVTPTPLTDNTLTYRDATVKVTLVVGSTVLTASVYVRQSIIDEDDERDQRVVNVNLIQDGTVMGNVVNEYTRFVGFPADMIAKENLLFAINDKNLLKYQIGIKSSMTWEIKPADALVMNRLSFSTMSGGGQNTPYEYIEVSANADFDDEAYLSSFGGYFTLEFENGDQMQFYAMQKGVLGVLEQYATINALAPVLTTDGSIYYYETIDLGPGTWLDRNIGADGTNNQGLPTVGKMSISDIPKYGKNIQGKDIATVCPKGFRVPRYGHATDEAAIKYIWDNAVFINDISVDTDGITHTGYTSRWAIRTTTNPEPEYYYPNPGAAKYTISTDVFDHPYLWLIQQGDGNYQGMLLGANGWGTYSSIIITILDGIYPSKLMTHQYAGHGLDIWAYQPASSTYSWVKAADTFATRNKYSNSHANPVGYPYYTASPIRCIRDLP